MNKVVIDTSVYIPIFRSGQIPGNLINSSTSIFYLSAVVAQELFAGAIDNRAIASLDDFFDVFERHKRVIMPSVYDWLQCGKVLSKIGKKHGFESIKKGRLVNDVLIALSCASEDAALITANHKDFKIINEFVNFQFLAI